VPFVIEEGDIGRPDIRQVGVYLTCPIRVALEDAPAEFPGDFIRGAEERDPAARMIYKIFSTLFGNDGVMHALEKALGLYHYGGR